MCPLLTLTTLLVQLFSLLSLDAMSSQRDIEMTFSKIHIFPLFGTKRYPVRDPMRTPSERER